MKFDPRYKIWEACLDSNSALNLAGKGALCNVWVEHCDPPLESGHNGEMIATDGVAFIVVPCFLELGDVPGQIQPVVLETYAEYFKNPKQKVEGLSIQMRGGTPNSGQIRIIDHKIIGSNVRQVDELNVWASRPKDYDVWFDWRSMFDWDLDFSGVRGTLPISLSPSRLFKLSQILGVPEDEGLMIVGGLEPRTPLFIQPLAKTEAQMIQPQPPCAALMPQYLDWMDRWSKANIGLPAGRLAPASPANRSAPRLKLKLEHYPQTEVTRTPAPKNAVTTQVYGGKPAPDPVQTEIQRLIDQKAAETERLTANALVEALAADREVDPRLIQYKSRKPRVKKGTFHE